MKTQIAFASVIAATLFSLSVHAADNMQPYVMPTPDVPARSADDDMTDQASKKVDGTNPYRSASFMARKMATANDRIVPVVNAALTAAKSNSWGTVVVKGDGAGMLVLSGLVTTRDQAMKALMIALETPGVKGVVNDIQVKATDRPSGQ